MLKITLLKRFLFSIDFFYTGASSENLFILYKNNCIYFQTDTINHIDLKHVT